MIASNIRIQSILGVDDVEIKPGRVTVIAGKNGTGKTSVLEAIKSIGVKGHDATLLRHGADEGRVVVELDNGGVIRRRVKTDKSDREYKSPDGTKGGATTIDAMFDAVSLNPVEFFTAEPKRKVELVMQALNLRVSDEQLSEAVGEAVSANGLGALEAIGAEYRRIYDLRTGANRAAKEKEAAIAQLGQAVPANVAGDVAAAMAEVKVQVDRVMRDLEDARKRALQWRDEQISAINQRYNELLQNAESDAANLLTPLNQRLGELQQAMQTKAAFEQAKRTIDQMTTELDSLREEQARYNGALERLQALKQSLLADLPFKGLHIEGTQIYIDGTPLERLNTASQIRFALQLALHRAGDLRIICLDGMELLDEHAFTSFVEAAKKLDGYQFFVTRVTNDEALTITTEGA